MCGHLYAYILCEIYNKKWDRLCVVTYMRTFRMK